MSIIMHALQDKSLRIPLLIIALLALLSLGAVVIRWWRLRQAIQTLEQRLEPLLTGRLLEPGSRDGSRALWRAVREQLVFPPGKQEVPGPVLMRSSPSRELRETCRALFRHSLGHGVGRNLTGIALVMTFGLLGVVLVGPVQEALASTGGGHSQSDLLSQAIGKMGAKFFISATGLVGTLLFQMVAFSFERRLLGQLDAMRLGFEKYTRTLDAHEIALASARGESLGSLKAELVQTRRELAEQLSQLESVNVSIQGIGTEVQAHFGKMMKEEVGDVITRQLSAVEKAVRDIATDLQRSISTNFTASLQLEMASIKTHLDGIQQALVGQQEHDLGRILEQLRDTVSGGFHTQSQDMARQMAGLAAVLPQLEKQLEAMTQMLGSQARQWGSENQRAVEALGAKVSELVGSFDGVRDNMEKAVAQVLRSTTTASVDLGRQNQQIIDQLSGSVSHIVDRFQGVLTGMSTSSDQLVLAAARVSKEMHLSAADQSSALHSQLEELRNLSKSDVGHFQARAAEFASAMKESQDSLRVVTKQLNETVDKLATASRSAGETHHKAGVVSEKMEGVAQRLIDTARTFHQLSQDRLGVVKQEETLLNAQREALERVTPVLNGLTRTYEESVSKQVQLLSSQWTQVVSKVDSALNRSSNEFFQGVEELSDAVNQLKDSLKQQVRR
ncbi:MULTISPECIES: hypothetical protein [unclassified Corallococcus]|uniref:hypothetical protein n=1 Tax=unclassified Corallococcus TaxID=2685029 RepID=UPI001A8D7F9E|nr:MULTISPECIES: hypothetical protein [unclassified Corallococcus]MBN9686389.1 hypothetical protein [Corallococcus sp. NCSPR001]WAS82184.1 hypothetical protein O0N60_22965 [Corallococcus sp. NCRR]